MAMTLVLAQEIVAIESGYRDWAALKAATREVVTRTSVEVSAPVLVGVVPILFVRDVETSAAFYKERLGARLHLRFVDQTNFADLAAREDDIVVRQPWGGLEFHVRDPDGNVISLVQFRRRAEESREGAE